VLNLKGHRVPVLTREQGVGRGLEPLSTQVNQADPHASGDTWTTYTAVPYFATSEKRGLLIETTHVSIFDFKDPNLIDIEVLGARTVHGRFLVGTDLFDLCEQYTEICGRMNALPKWVGDVWSYSRSRMELLSDCRVVKRSSWKRLRL
jgi:alpha-glucosidase (family GH31 glycosyl hydrolase)